MFEKKEWLFRFIPNPETIRGFLDRDYSGPRQPRAIDSFSLGIGRPGSEGYRVRGGGGQVGPPFGAR